LAWKDKSFDAFATAVSLHSHTLHSKESMEFIRRVTRNVPWLSGAVRRQEEKYRRVKGRDLDLTRAWWTPPLASLPAWELEASQIERKLGMAALVSLSDHDDIEAPLHLRLLDRCRDCPISVEWTVPYRETFFHLGVHNIPAVHASAVMREMRSLTSKPCERRIAELLSWLNESRDCLIVFNHPMWDENHVGDAHRPLVNSFLALYQPHLHALELNGLRPWGENRQTMDLAASVSLPVISGGDRHGREPNACLNLTNALTFGEFACEIREDGWSDVLFMPHYREPLRLRILENLCDILEDDPSHGLGWIRWSDRVFYVTDEGIVKSLAEFWGSRAPGVVSQFVGLMRLVRHRRVRSALRVALREASGMPLGSQ
jgi:hypothetical protein